MFVSTDVIERWIDFYSYTVPTHSSLVAVAHNTQPRPLLGSSKQCNNARDALLRLPEGCDRERERNRGGNSQQIGRQHICRINDTQQNCGEIWWEGRLKLKWQVAIRGAGARARRAARAKWKLGNCNCHGGNIRRQMQCTHYDDEPPQKPQECDKMQFVRKRESGRERETELASQRKLFCGTFLSSKRHLSWKFSCPAQQLSAPRQMQSVH